MKPLLFAGYTILRSLQSISLFLSPSPVSRREIHDLVVRDAMATGRIFAVEPDAVMVSNGSRTCRILILSDPGDVMGYVHGMKARIGFFTAVRLAVATFDDRRRIAKARRETDKRARTTGRSAAAARYAEEISSFRSKPDQESVEAWKAIQTRNRPERW